MTLRSTIWQHTPKFILRTLADVTKLRHADRIFIRDTIVPSIVKHRRARVMNVGVHYYTQALHEQLLKGGAELHTADIDEKKRMWGSGHRHAVCGSADLHLNFPSRYFDFVLLVGVLGYGIDDQESRKQAVESIAEIMGDTGILIIGWDENMSDDPLEDHCFVSKFSKNHSLLGRSRFRLKNGMYDKDGRECFKVFDLVSKAT